MGYFLLCCTSASLLGAGEGVGTAALGIEIYAPSLFASRGMIRVKHYGRELLLRLKGNTAQVCSNWE